MKKFTVTGMSCAACSARVEKAVSKVDGVTSCSVNLLTNSMVTEGNASEQAIINAVTDAGYGAFVEEKKSSEKSSVKGKKSPAESGNAEISGLLARLFWSAGFVLVLMYFSMGHMMWNWKLPVFYNENHIAMGLTQLLLAGIVMIINGKFFVSGTKSLLHKAPNMDTLVSLGSGTSFVWSVYMLFVMTSAQVAGDKAKVLECMDNFYFESAAMILVLITTGKTLEAYSKGKTTNALKSLMELAPETAVILKDGREVTVDVDEVKPGDVFVVRTGEKIPVDAEVIEGNCAADESLLTGESVPVEKEAGSKVKSGTFNQSGFIKCRALKVGEDTTLSQIIKMVSDASATKAPIAKIADKVSGVFVPVVIGIAAVSFFVWLCLGKEFAFALERGISVLVISCPCALGLATPVAVMVGNGVSARNGILFKNSESLEETGKIKTAVLDKTGTVTTGKMKVTDIHTGLLQTQDFLDYAFAVEKLSEHPVAKSITEYCSGKVSGKNVLVENFKSLPGNGLEAVADGKKILAGNLKFICENISLPEKVNAFAAEISAEGKTPVLFAVNSEYAGMFAVADTLKGDSKDAVEMLKSLGIEVVMLTGDNERTAKAVAKECGIENVIAEVLPGDKAAAVEKLKLKGKVLMAGDGINDAPALTVADIGVAIGNGTDVAVDAADVVLMNNSIKDICKAIRISRATLLNIKENLFWAFIYNIIGIPLAAGVFIKLFGWTLNPMFGATAMSLSSFCVVSNALRLNFFNADKSGKKLMLKNKNISKELSMTKTIKIEGMMCSHCEGHVKQALEGLDGVDQAVASSEKGTAVVTLSRDVDEKTLCNAVTAAGYKPLSVE